MRAYEFLAKVAPEGKLELPDVKLEDLPYNPVVRFLRVTSTQLIVMTTLFRRLQPANKFRITVGA